MDTSKPANGAEPGQEYLYRAEAEACLSKWFFVNQPDGYTGRAWAEDTATQGCDRSADSGPGFREGEFPFQLALLDQESWLRAINPRGMGTESPSTEPFLTMQRRSWWGSKCVPLQYKAFQLQFVLDKAGEKLVDEHVI